MTMQFRRLGSSAPLPSIYSPEFKFSEPKKSWTTAHMVPANAPRQELTVPQKAADDLGWDERDKLVKRPTKDEYDAARTVVFKVWGRPEYWREGSRDIAVLSAAIKGHGSFNKPEKTFKFLVWHSDERSFCVLPFEHPFCECSAGYVVRDYIYGNRLRVSRLIETAWYSPKTPEELIAELRDAPADPRYVPDAEELQRRADKKEREREAENAKRRWDSLSRDAREINRDFQDRYRAAAPAEERIEFILSFERDIIKLARRVDRKSAESLSEALAATDSMPVAKRALTLSIVVSGIMNEFGRASGGRYSAERKIESAIEKLIECAAAGEYVWPKPEPKPEPKPKPNPHANQTYCDLDGRPFPRGYLPPWIDTFRGGLGVIEDLKRGVIKRSDLPWASRPETYEVKPRTAQILARVESLPWGHG